MPCDCSGYPVEVSAFGKTYTGYSTNSGDTINYQQVIKDGEHALCRAQQVIREMDAFISNHGKSLGHPLFQRVQAELGMLNEHERAERAKVNEQLNKELFFNELEKRNLQAEKAKIEARLSEL